LKVENKIHTNVKNLVMKY